MSSYLPNILTPSAFIVIKIIVRTGIYSRNEDKNMKTHQQCGLTVLFHNVRCEKSHPDYSKWQDDHQPRSPGTGLYLVWKVQNHQFTTERSSAAYRMVTTRFLSTNLAPPTFPCIAGGSFMMRLWSPASISSSEPPLYCIFQIKGLISMFSAMAQTIQK